MSISDPAIDEEKAEVDLTPMLDVVFIMLVFFVVTASFVRESGVPVYLPANAEAPPNDVESIIVSVLPASTFVVNERVLSKASLVPYIQAVYSQNPEAGFAIVVAEGSKVRDTVAAADAGRIVGFDVIPITTNDR